MEKIYKINPKPIQKMAIGRYISIITLNVNGLSAPNKRYRLAERIKEKQQQQQQPKNPYIRCLQETYLRPEDTYRLKVRGWKNWEANWEAKESWSSNPHIRHNRPSHEDYKKKRRTLHDQGINPRERHNNCKYLCTQHRSTSIHKTNTNRYKRRN